MGSASVVPYLFGELSAGFGVTNADTFERRRKKKVPERGAIIIVYKCRWCVDVGCIEPEPVGCE